MFVIWLSNATDMVEKLLSLQAGFLSTYNSKDFIKNYGLASSKEVTNKWLFPFVYFYTFI